MNTTDPTIPHGTTDVPDLTTYRVIHRAMRADIRRLADALTSIDPDDRRRVRAVATWFAGYRGELHEHHTTEDEIFFPALADKVPTFRHHLARVDDEHAELDHLLDRTDRALATLVGPMTDLDAARSEAAEATATLATLVEHHLDFEDADVLPLFERHLTAEEYAAVEARALEGVNVRQALFSVPWLMAWATREEQATMLDGAPVALKAVWYARRRAYRRLAARVFAAPTGTEVS